MNRCGTAPFVSPRERVRQKQASGSTYAAHQPGDRRSRCRRASTMRGARLVGVVVATGIGFVIGFYAGFFVLLSTVGLDEFEGWQFELTTMPAAGLVAGLAAVAASPDRQRIWRPVVVTSIVTGLITTGVLLLIDGDFGIAMGVGGPIVVGSTVLAAWNSHRNQTKPPD